MKKYVKKIIYHIINSFNKKEVYKYWRIDCKEWETKSITFWFVKYYKYEVWDNGKNKKEIKLIKKPNEKYFKKPVEVTFHVGRREFKEIYNNNKHMIPMNYKLNLDMP